MKKIISLAIAIYLMFSFSCTGISAEEITEDMDTGISTMGLYAKNVRAYVTETHNCIKYSATAMGTVNTKSISMYIYLQEYSSSSGWVNIDYIKVKSNGSTCSGSDVYAAPKAGKKYRSEARAYFYGVGTHEYKKDYSVVLTFN